MKTSSQHLVNMLRFLYVLGFLNREDVIRKLNTEPLRTWQRLDQISKILDVEVMYDFPDED